MSSEIPTSTIFCYPDDVKGQSNVEVLNVNNVDSSGCVVLNDEKLLELIQLYPFLYNPRVRPFQDADYDDWAWNRITSAFNLTYTGFLPPVLFTKDDLLRRWNKLQPIIMKMAKMLDLTAIPEPLRQIIVKINIQLEDQITDVRTNNLTQAQQIIYDNMKMVEQLPLSRRLQLEAEMMDLVLNTELDSKATIKLTDANLSSVDDEYEELLDLMDIKELIVLKSTYKPCMTEIKDNSQEQLVTSTTSNASYETSLLSENSSARMPKMNKKSKTIKKVLPKIISEIPAGQISLLKSATQTQWFPLKDSSKYVKRCLVRIKRTNMEDYIPLSYISRQRKTSTRTTAYNRTMDKQPDEPEDVTNEPLPSMSAPKTRAQIQREESNNVQPVQCQQHAQQSTTTEEQPNERVNLKKEPLSPAIPVPMEDQEAVASASAMPFTKRITAAPKTRAQIQREYRQRIAALQTPAQKAAARQARKVRERNKRLRKAANLAIASVEAVASASATPFTKRITAAPKTRAQIQREYRQRIAASQTPAQKAAARKARKVRDRLRKVTNLAIASGYFGTTTPSSSRSGEESNNVQPVQCQQHAQQSTTTEDQPNERVNLKKEPLFPAIPVLMEDQEAVASASAMPFTKRITAAPKTRAQIQREYRQRIAALQTPAEKALARKARKVRYQLRKTVNLAIASGYFGATTPSSSRSGEESNNVQPVQCQQHAQQSTTTEDQPNERVNLTKEQLFPAIPVPIWIQESVASTSATPCTKRITAAPKTRAQIQREYRQRIAALQTPAQKAAARKARNVRVRNNRLRQAANWAIASGSLEATTTSSSRSGEESNNVQPVQCQQSTTTEDQPDERVNLKKEQLFPAIPVPIWIQESVASTSATPCTKRITAAPKTRAQIQHYAKLLTGLLPVVPLKRQLHLHLVQGKSRTMSNLSNVNNTRNNLPPLKINLMSVSISKRSHSFRQFLFPWRIKKLLHQQNNTNTKGKYIICSDNAAPKLKLCGSQGIAELVVTPLLTKQPRKLAPHQVFFTTFTLRRILNTESMPLLKNSHTTIGANISTPTPRNRPDIPSNCSSLQLKIFTRCRLSHTKISHEHLLTGKAAPECSICNRPLSIKHILDHCPKFSNSRKNIFKNQSPSVALIKILTQ
ncbi:uncharacterized protein LOC128866087 isoform X2 [Anastrepha ludens]|uniref:uncharacterized protein LOC128866087 isoform X2 n=1 Tax=Anastrepha ludens TaxID=28586 RepID=UPI0023B1245B|nr:uncharacterized protein LOC128866087 isoform X2 [Anastrepha ludens]